MTDGQSKIRDSGKSDSDVPPQSKRGRRRVNVICDSDDSDIWTLLAWRNVARICSN